MSVRGVPDQDLPENQDPSVAYNEDWLTGEKTPYEKPKAKVAERPEPAKKAAAPAPPKVEHKDADSK